jgi:TrmH family RNA methyltransferase
MQISSLANPRVKHVVALNDKKQRDDDHLMLIEGFDPLSLALECGIQPKTVFVCAELHKPSPIQNAHDKLMRRIIASGAEIIETTRAVFEKMAYRDGPDGWLAVAPKPNFSLSRLQSLQSASPLILVAERVEKPGNLGAMLRTCDAAGVDAFITCDLVADLSNPNVVRASQGTLFSVQVAQASSKETLAWLRQRGVKIVATTPNDFRGATPLPHTQFDYTQPCAVVVGEEKYGLSKFWLDHADSAVRIPMRGRINSLNVATSAALVIYEANRQRG